MRIHITTEATVISETGLLKYPRIGYQTHARGLLAASVVVSGEEAGFPADAPLRPDTYESWKPPSVPATWRVDLGSAQDVNYVGLYLLESGVSVQVHYSDNDTDWTVASDVHALEEGANLLLFPNFNARYVRYTFTLAVPRLFVQHLGTILVMPRTIYGGHAPITLSHDTVHTRALSRTGNFLGQTIRKQSIATGVSFKYLAPAWVRSTFRPFMLAAKEYPYFWAWRADTYPEELAYAWALDDIKPSNMGKRDFMQVDWKKVGLSHD